MGELVQRPTHRVKHVDGYEAHIYIARSLFNKLHDRDPETRNRARSSVAIRTRKAFEAKYNDWNYNRFIQWDQIVLTALDSETTNKVECDDCPSCDIGYHERCRNGCTSGKK